MFSLQKKRVFFTNVCSNDLEVKKATGKSWNFTSFTKKLKIQNKKINIISILR
jgi:hypothetical protein